MTNKMVECWLCGTKHEYCSTCQKTHGWKFMADTHEHYQILMTKRYFEEGVFSKEEAIAVFEKCGVKREDNLSWMIPEVEKEIRGIIGQKTQKEKPERKNK